MQDNVGEVVQTTYNDREEDSDLLSHIKRILNLAFFI